MVIFFCFMGKIRNKNRTQKDELQQILRFGFGVPVSQSYLLDV